MNIPVPLEHYTSKMLEFPHIEFSNSCPIVALDRPQDTSKTTPPLSSMTFLVWQLNLQ